MTVLNTITMDLLQLSRPRVNVVAGTVDCYQLALRLYEGDTPWEIPEGTTVSVRYGKSDGTFGVYDTLSDGTAAWAAQGNQVTVALAPQMLTAAGVVDAQVVLRHGAKVLPTFTVEIGVQHDPSFEAVTSEDYVNWFAMYENALAESIAQLQETFWQVTESATHPGCRYVTVNGVTEWLNPPMVMDEEYRTTERWAGKPVYRKQISYVNGAELAGDALTNIAHGITNLDRTNGVEILCRTQGYQIPYLTIQESTAVTGCSMTNIELRTTGTTRWSAGRTWYFELAYTKTTD